MNEEQGLVFKNCKELAELLGVTLSNMLSMFTSNYMMIWFSHT